MFVCVSVTCIELFEYTLNVPAFETLGQVALDTKQYIVKLSNELINVVNSG